MLCVDVYLILHCVEMYTISDLSYHLGLVRPDIEGLLISPEDDALLRLARLPKLKLGRETLGGGDVADLMLPGLSGAIEVEGLFAFSASDRRNSTKRFENDCKGKWYDEQQSRIEGNRRYRLHLLLYR